MARVGIVGCGGIAQVHAAVLDRLPGVELAACADILPERAQALANRYGCAAFASLEDMLRAGGLDAVHICTPHWLHVPMAEAVADAGAAVFTEKPPAIDRDQWRRLLRVAERVPVGVCFQNRYNPNVRELKRLIDEGTYGAPVGARAFVTWSRSEAYYRDSGWRGAWATEGGGALINQSVHTLDLLIWLLGPAERVEAHMANRHLPGAIEVEDTVEAYLTPGGHPALFYASTAYTRDAPVLLEVQLERAVVRLVGADMDIEDGAGPRRLSFPQPEALGKGYWGNGHMPCIADFYRCLAAGAPFANAPEGVRDTVDAVLRLYEQGRKDL